MPSTSINVLIGRAGMWHVLVIHSSSVALHLAYALGKVKAVVAYGLRRD